jgi:hypothetical protein
MRQRCAGVSGVWLSTGRSPTHQASRPGLERTVGIAAPQARRVRLDAFQQLLSAPNARVSRARTLQRRPWSRYLSHPNLRQAGAASSSLPHIRFANPLFAFLTLCLRS